MIYLAGPYTHKDPAVVHARYEAHRKACAQLLKDGHTVFSPIVHGHNMLPELDHWRHEEWMEYDMKILNRCDHIIVLTIDGWKESRGTQEEIRYCLNQGIRIEYMALKEVA